MNAEYLNHYLTDHDIANFARLSFASNADKYTKMQNDNLVRYLARGLDSNSWKELMLRMIRVGSENLAADLAFELRTLPTHWVPFGHPQITIRMTAPIPIKVQCFKHKIGFVESEESRRYITTTPPLFVPEHFRAAAADKKQGSGGEHGRSMGWLDEYQSIAQQAIKTYEDMIADGVAPEQARFILPQGCEAQWVWTGSLFSWARAYNLRRPGSHAQGEIQDLFKKIDAIIEPLFPVAWPALARGEY